MIQASREKNDTVSRTEANTKQRKAQNSRDYRDKNKESIDSSQDKDILKNMKTEKSCGRNIFRNFFDENSFG